MKKCVKKLIGLPLIAMVLILSLLPVIPATAANPEYDFTTIDIPNSILTAVWGINPGGVAVGVYQDALGVHGFSLADGNYTVVDQGAGTTLIGIGPSGEIVGDYQPNPAETWHWHGFQVSKTGDIIQISDPNHTSIVPMRILPDGTIIGFVRDSSTFSTQHGVVIYPDGTIEYPDIAEFEGLGSQHTGATPDAKTIVGYFGAIENGPCSIYVIDNGNITTFTAPFPNTTATLAFDIHPGGKIIVGQYVTKIGNTVTGIHGFVAERCGKAVNDWKFTTVDVPGAFRTFMRGINANGDLVGFYYAGKLKGFIATRADD